MRGRRRLWKKRTKQLVAGLAASADAALAAARSLAAVAAAVRRTSDCVARPAGPNL